MAIMNAVKQGADLTHPKASVGWVVGAVVAVILLAAVAGIGIWAYGRLKAVAGGKSANGADTAGAGMGSGIGAGWL